MTSRQPWVKTVRVTGRGAVGLNGSGVVTAPSVPSSGPARTVARLLLPAGAGGRCPPAADVVGSVGRPRAGDPGPTGEAHGRGEEEDR
ncbi:hypothetical protein [Modestobacter sp. URMC 112]